VQRWLIVGVAVCALGTPAFDAQPARAATGEPPCCAVAYGGAATSTSISTWAAGLSGGGVQRPGGRAGPACTRWASATSINPASATDVSSFRVDPDGVAAELHFRDCGPVRQLVWIRRETPQSLSRIALSDLRSRALVTPEATLSPPHRGIVNLETWLAVADPGPITVSAAIPDLSVTATAEIESTTWDMGNGDTVTCESVGVPWSDGTDASTPAPCGYSYTAGSGGPLDVTATVTWRASWRASDGTTGDLGTVQSAAFVTAYPVHEIETIGVAG
jgi:hypothetical protein